MGHWSVRADLRSKFKGGPNLIIQGSVCKLFIFYLQISKYFKIQGGPWHPLVIHGVRPCWSGEWVKNFNLNPTRKKNCVDLDPTHLIIMLNLTTYTHLFMSCSYRVIGLCQILPALYKRVRVIKKIKYGVRIASLDFSSFVFLRIISSKD